jgi:hypothetical protein
MRYEYKKHVEKTDDMYFAMPECDMRRLRDGGRRWYV